MKASREAESTWAALAFAATLLLAGLFAYALTRPAAPGSHGMPHPEIAGLLQGGSGALRHGSMLWLGWAIGCAQILLFGALMALGSRRGRRLGGPQAQNLAGSLRGFGRPLLAGLLAYLGVFSLLMVTYARYLQDPSPGLLFALPASTALMLFVLWPLPVFFAVCYVLGFRRFVFTEADEQAFRELVERRHATATPGAAAGTEDRE